MKFILAMSLIIFSSTVFADCYEDTEKNSPTSRFELSNEGWAIDKKTNLMWMRCSVNQTWDGTNCNGDQTMVYDTALEVANEYSFAEFSDWRLPNIKELVTIVANNCYQPAINLEVFPNTSSSISNSYWSSTDSPNTNQTWSVNFVQGTARPNISNAYFYVRLVRDITN